MLKPSVSLVITTYNRPNALRIVLKSVERQTVHPDEIIVADDGSTPDTAHVVSEFAQYSKIKTIHSWQQDNGFRLATSRNKAIAQSSCDYIILIDGDMLLHKDYVQHHMQAIRSGTMYINSRAFLSQSATERLERLGQCEVCKQDIEKNHLHRLYIPFLYLLLPRIKEFRHAKGYMGFWRKDCLAVNGFNELFEGWGGEDVDFMMRMIHSGVVARKLKFAAITYHLYHQEASRSKQEHNHRILLNTLENKTVRCEQGIASRSPAKEGSVDQLNS